LSTGFFLKYTDYKAGYSAILKTAFYERPVYTKYV